MTKILVVEDDKNILRSLSVRLRAEGLEVVTAMDAMMATMVAVKEKPDLAILDISLPAGNGFQLAERIQENSHTAGMPMIFITASKKPGLEKTAKDLGAIAFFSKPYDAAALVTCVREALGLGTA